MTEYLHTIHELIRKHLRGEMLSSEEQAQLEGWVNASAQNAEVLNHLEDDSWLAENLFYLENVDTEKIWRNMEPLHQEEKVIRVRKIPWPRIAAAAVFAGILVAGSFYIARLYRKVAPTVVPGIGATLTLADRSTQNLDNMDSGLLTEVDNVKIIKQGSHRLAYEVQGKARPADTAHIVYNTLAILKGGQYQLILPDSTKVWLNSVSSLRYPAIFTEKSREVTLTGEAYFEVAKNAGAPFKVKANGLDITVLGTSFNVKSYPQEGSVNITVKSGSVEVSKGGKKNILQAGEQAVWDSSAAEIRVISGRDIDGVIAWTSDNFHFDDMDIPTAMWEVGRYYGMDIKFMPGIAGGSLAKGTFQRTVSLQHLLEMAERKHLHFRIEEKTIIVEP
ncbi:MAG TPA: FecR domain-containing protein [Puia sp.]|nr:FecR domain-containing protein [Puia sp.]